MCLANSSNKVPAKQVTLVPFHTIPIYPPICNLASTFRKAIASSVTNVHLHIYYLMELLSTQGLRISITLIVIETLQDQLFQMIAATIQPHIIKFNTRFMI
jgi:hypothetical protein